MQLVVICLISAVVLVSPCVYDTDPREPTPVAAAIAKALSPNRSPELAAAHISSVPELPAIAP
jgi:hypothetical protein